MAEITVLNWIHSIRNHIGEEKKCEQGGNAIYGRDSGRNSIVDGMKCCKKTNKVVREEKLGLERRRLNEIVYSR